MKNFYIFFNQNYKLTPWNIKSNFRLYKIDIFIALTGFFHQILFYVLLDKINIYDR